MTEESRREWLTVAWGTLTGIPADLLKRGCAEARKTADHPSKIVPIIIREVRETWDRRKELYGRAEPSTPQPALEHDFVPCTPEQAEEILREFGLKANPLSGEG